jgi:hypothetical protein
VDGLFVLQEMNRTQIAIIASWVILVCLAICIISKVTHHVPYGLILFLFVREQFVDEKASMKQYFSERRKRTIALMISSISPFLWYLYRLFSAPDLPDTFGVEAILSSLPLLTLIAIYDRWLWLRSSGASRKYSVVDP